MSWQFSRFSEATLLVLKLEYSRTRSMTWLLMPWFLVSPGHQQQCYGLHRINSFSFSCKNEISNTWSILVLTNDTKCKLTLCGLVTPYGDIIWVNIGSGNGLLPDGTKPLPEPMLTYHQSGLVAFTQWQFHTKCSIYLSLIQVWKSLI